MDTCETTLVPLEPFLYQDMRPCERCGGPQNFVDVYEFISGGVIYRAGYCEGCGEEKQRFTRTVGEAA